MIKMINHLVAEYILSPGKRRKGQIKLKAGEGQADLRNGG